MSEVEIPDGSYAVISLRQPIAKAKTMLRLTDVSDYDRTFEMYANDAAKRIDAGDQYLVEDAILDVVDNDYSVLPCGFDQLISLRFGAGESCFGLYYIDLPFLKSCGCGIGANAAHFANVMRIQDGKIFYPFGVQQPNATSVTNQVTLSYWGTNTDENGLRKIYSHYEDAIAYFICYNFTLSYSERYKQFVINEYKQNWIAQMEYIRGKWQQKQFRNKKRQIAQTTNAWISAKQWAH